MKIEPSHWCSGEFFLGFSWSSDDRSFGIHFFKWILYFTFRPYPGEVEEK